MIDPLMRHDVHTCDLKEAQEYYELLRSKKTITINGIPFVVESAFSGLMGHHFRLRELRMFCRGVTP